MNLRAPELIILILAGGFSARLGVPKALARIHGVSLLTRTLRAAAVLSPAWIGVVVPPGDSRFGHQARGIKVRVLPNRLRAEGVASSVRLGVRNARFAAGVMLLPVDLIDLTHRDLALLLSRWRLLRRRVVAAHVGTHGGIPLILPARLFPAAARLKGDTGLRTLLMHLPSDERLLVPLSSAAQDIDTPADLAAARNRWRAAARR